MRKNGYRGDPETRDKVLAVFADMRKDGYIARANFMCCSGCAGYDLATKVSEMADKKKADGFKGVLFWHRQDEQDWQEYGTLAIRYGAVSTQKHGRLGIPDEETGQLLVEKLKAVGVDVEWNGDPHLVVYVFAPGVRGEDHRLA